MDSKKVFSGKKNFEGIIFYYYLPRMNYLEKKPIGEEISKYKGVKIFNFLKNFSQYLFHFKIIVSY
jgi:hypothetical protein